MTSSALAGNIIHFARYLRAKGLDIDPRTGMDLLTSAHILGLEDGRDVKSGFRSLVVTRPDQVPVFDAAFDLFFGSGSIARPSVEVKTDRLVQSYLPLLVRAGRVDGEQTESSTEQMGASEVERLGTRDFGELTPEEIAEVRRMISRMVWKPAEAASRRWVADSKGRRPDMRRTLRNSVGPRGELLEMEFRSRKPRRRPLVVLADVSGSMEKYVEMLLYFAHSAPARMGRVETFVFSTRLTRITHELRRRDPAQALRLVADRVHDWSGGTRIGAALETYNRLWSRRVARGGPIGMIISDGWDRGDPNHLGREMARFSRSVYRTIWLNPLAGRRGYAPETRGLRAVLPFVDDFLPAARLVDLAGVIRLLESIPSRPGQSSARSSTRGAIAS
ncbi:MAG: VWA domain-containing protein [Acidimicrobiia bacterium]|nr:VWA domain-containing protein [bacterium]MXZ06106.1 VWA domain-containing protein [Acidimicrobiia bacterium]MCY3652867.1 VWA domain-containing protein [bacterium]MDE0643677.1 VWA domain-containing protein [bacterium]MYD03736.1 VWA domain-containing protein [Acidimicrobiia bacterium]